MQFFTLFELILTLLGTFYLLSRYSSKNVPTFVKVVCFITWFLCFAILIFVPLDVYYTLREISKHSEDWRSENNKKNLVFEESFRGMVTVWTIVYWTTFIFTWVILPIVQEYMSAGDFSIWGKIKRSIKYNLFAYGVMAVFGGFFILYLKASGGFGGDGVIPFLITYSNCFGIILIIVCLSYGLVFIPKRCLRETMQGLNLKTYHYQAAVIEEQKDSLLFEFEELIKTIEALLKRDDINQEEKVRLNQIMAEIPEDLVNEVRDVLRISNLPSMMYYEKFSKEKLVSLNTKVKKKLNKLRRLDHKWEVTLNKGLFIEDIMSSRNPAEWRGKMSYSPCRFKFLEKFVSVLEWAWYKYLSRVVLFLVGLCLIGFSIVVFFAEIFTFGNFRIFSLETFISTGKGAVLKSQFLCLIPLFYILICVYSAIFNMKFAGRYGLYGDHQTDGPSLIFASLNFSRVSSPLVFNFLQMLKLKGTAFQTVMGNVHFATNFIKYFPLLLVVLIFCNVFEIYGRILAKLGLNKFKFDGEATNERVEEGRRLLNKVRTYRSRPTFRTGSKTVLGRHKINAKNPQTEVSADRQSNFESPEKEMVIPRGYSLNALENYNTNYGRSIQDI